MNFVPSYPVVTAQQLCDLENYVSTVSPVTVEISGIIEVFREIGRILLSGPRPPILIPACVRDWVDKIPYPRLLFAENICLSLISSAHYITADHQERALYALTALQWIRQAL